MNRRRLPPFLAVVLVALPSCGGRGGTALETPHLRERPRPPGIGIGALGNSGNRTSDVATLTRGDLKTFAYASSDAKALAAEVTAVAAPGGASSVSYDAVELLDEAQRLERLAGSAKRRLRGADPTNPTLVGARREGPRSFPSPGTTLGF